MRFVRLVYGMSLLVAGCGGGGAEPAPPDLVAQPSDLAVASPDLAAATDAGGDAGAGGFTSCAGIPPTTLDELFAKYFAANASANPNGCAQAKCHGGGAGELTFSDAASFYVSTVNVTAVQAFRYHDITPGEPLRSFVFVRLGPQSPGDRMPPLGPYLDDAALTEIAGWICAGAKPPKGLPDGGVVDMVTPPDLLVPNPVPMITTIAPTTLTAGVNGATLTITGTGFVAASQAQAGMTALATKFTNATTLSATLPANLIASGGVLPITVVNPAPGGGTSNAVNLTVNNPAPALSSVSPSQVGAGGAAFTLTVNGTGFTPASVATWNGMNLMTSFVGATQLHAQVPANLIAAAGTAPIKVTNPAPGGGTSSAITLTINACAAIPYLTGIAPTSVQDNTNFQLTATGACFVCTSPGAKILVNGVAQTTTCTANTLTAAVAGMPGGVYPVSVKNPAGAGSAASFNLNVQNPVPMLMAVADKSSGNCGGVAGPNAITLLLTGANFTAKSTVTVAGQAATVTFVSANTLNATITIANAPANNLAPVIVTNPAPGGGASNAVNFGVASAVSTLSGNVQPIFTQTCAGGACHSGVGQALPGVMNLTAGNAYKSLVGVKAMECNGMLERVVACDPSTTSSYLVQKIKATAMNPPCQGVAMPKGSTITAAQTQAIVDWIAAGAIDN